MVNEWVPNGVIGNTTDSGSVKSRFEPWLGNKKSRTNVRLFCFSLVYNHLPKCIRMREAKMSTTTGLEPRGRMMSAVRLVGSMNCWCMGLTKVW